MSKMIRTYFQMCRLIYELAQVLHCGAHSFQSLDDTYFVAGESLGQGRVRRDHIPIRPTELHVHQGDLVSFLGNHWDGYALASGPMKGQTGLLPAFKIDEIFRMHNYSSKIKT